MKFLPVLIMLLFGCSVSKSNSHTFNQHAASLAKYSYFIVGFVGEEVVPMGTGFFIRSDSGHYFITAKHLISEKGVFSHIGTQLRPEEIGIMHSDSNGHPVGFIKLTTGPITRQLQQKLYYQEADMIIFHIIGLDKITFINAIDESLLKSKTGKQPDEVIAWGYGLDYDALKNKNANTIKPELYKGTIADSLHLDPSNYKNDTLNHVIQPETKIGHSGAPAFFSYSKKNLFKRAIWYELGGLVFSGNKVYKSAFIVNRKTLMTQLKDPTVPKYRFNF